MDYYTVPEMAEALGISQQAFRKRYKQLMSGWLTRKRIGRKGGGSEYGLASLPDELRQAFEGFESSTTVETIPVISLTPEEEIAPLEDLLQPADRPMPEQAERNLTEVDAWLEVFRVQQQWCIDNHLNKRVDCDSAFAEACKAGRVTLADWVLQFFGVGLRGLSRANIARMRGRLQKQGPQALCKGYGTRKGKGRLETSPQLQQIVDGCLKYLGQVATPTRVLKLLQTRVSEVPELADVSYDQVQRYLYNMQRENRARWLMLTDRKAARNTVLPAFGSRSRDLQPNDIWEIDFTRNDLILTWEGVQKRFSLGMCVDVATRRCRILLSPTPRGEATARLVLKCLEAWGKPKTLKPDNGKEFINQRVKALCGALEIELDPCIPGQPEGKPHVERLIGVFNHDALTLLPSYVGSNVAERQAIREHKGGDEALIELAMDFARFQDWCDDWCKQHEQQHHERLGCTPLEKLARFTQSGWQRTPVGMSADQLAILALPSKVCTVNRDGIRLSNRRYVAGELGGEWITQKVKVVYDPGNPSRVRVFTEDLQTFVCWADWETSLTAEEQAQIAGKAKALTKAVNVALAEATKEASKVRRRLQLNPEQMVEAPDLMPFERIGEVFTNSVTEALTQATGAEVIPLFKTAQPGWTEEEEALHQQAVLEAQQRELATVKRPGEDDFDTWWRLAVQTETGDRREVDVQWMLGYLDMTPGALEGIDPFFWDNLPSQIKSRLPMAQ